MFEFLQGNIRINEYVETFKFYDYQVIQMSGLSPSSFGYEKDAYQNVDNINMSKNPSDMTIEAIKRQITPAINLLFENIIKAQHVANVTENVLPTELSWDFGPNEKFGDIDKIKILRNIQGVASIPQSSKIKVILPILNKLIDDTYVKDKKTDIDDLLKELKSEQDDLSIRFGEM